MVTGMRFIQLNSTKRWLYNKKSDMMSEVTLIQNLKMNIVTKLQVAIFQNDEVRGGGSFFPSQRDISCLRGNMK